VRISLIIRPREGPAELEALHARVRALRGRGHHVWPRLTFEGGDGTREAAEAARRGADVIVAVGGDGTLNEVVNGVMGEDWSGRLGVVPRGTANDFAEGLGMPVELDAALEVAVNGPPRPVDVGCVNDRYFLNVSTGGFGAEAAKETRSEVKRLLGPLAYVVTGVRKFAELTPSPALFEGTNGSIYDGEVTLFAVGNAKQTGGGNLLTPRAVIDDGLLDLMIVPGMPRMEFLSLLPDLRSGAHLDHPAIVYIHTPRLVVSSEAELSVNADGQPMGGRRFTYGVADRQILVNAPPARAESAAVSDQAP
jgi:diacylglycerol kinase (ATP)